MKKIYFFIFAGIIVLIVAFLLFGFTKPDESIKKAQITETQNPQTSFTNQQKIPLNDSQYNLSFEGYGPGRSHLGNFSNVSGNYIAQENNLEYVELKIDATSVKTGIDRLNNHLISIDFFDAQNNPEIIFISKEIRDNEITGDLTLKGITKEISFPIEREQNTIYSEFLLNISEFDISYVGVNEEVKIELSFEF